MDATEPQQQLNKALARGIDYLEEHQYPSGEFCCYIAADEPMQGWCITDSTVFASMVVAACLLPLAKRPNVDVMIHKATDYIVDQMHEGGVWPVFSERHPWHRAVPYDADSLVYASDLLEVRGIRYARNSTVPLLLANCNRQGLFYTWFVLRSRWHTNRTHWQLAIQELGRPITSFFFWRANECTRADIDLGINLNILYYLGDTASTQPIIAACLRMIAERREADSDKWYRNPYNMYYLLSRPYQRGVTGLKPVIQPIVERITAQAQPSGQLGKSVLDTAFAITALLNFGVDTPLLDNAIAFLLKTQGPGGEWSRRLFYYGGPKLLQGWGSEEITTGFCLEALALYQQHRQTAGAE